MTTYKTLVNKIVELSKKVSPIASTKNMDNLMKSLEYHHEIIENWQNFAPEEKEDLSSLLLFYDALESKNMKSIRLRDFASSYRVFSDKKE